MNASTRPLTSDSGCGPPDERAGAGGGDAHPRTSEAAAPDGRAAAHASSAAAPDGRAAAHASSAAALMAEASRRLHSVSRRLRTFLQQKLKQFEAVSLNCESIVAQRDSLLRLKEELLRDKGEWERRRQGQMDELRGEQDRLIEAWQKLEDEQRQILVQQETLHLQGCDAPGGADFPLPSFAAAAPSSPASPFQPNAAAVYAEPRHQHASVARGMSRESALDQFQRLKREIQKHVKRLQEPPCG